MYICQHIFKINLNRSFLCTWHSKAPCITSVSMCCNLRHPHPLHATEADSPHLSTKHRTPMLAVAALDASTPTPTRRT
jgi:hypothetical protein